MGMERCQWGTSRDKACEEVGKWQVLRRVDSGRLSLGLPLCDEHVKGVDTNMTLDMQLPVKVRIW